VRLCRLFLGYWSLVLDYWNGILLAQSVVS
jgi:hypothetical protein